MRASALGLTVLLSIGVLRAVPGSEPGIPRGTVGAGANSDRPPSEMAAAAHAPPRSIFSCQTTFAIPFTVDMSEGRAQEVLLFVSTDHGKTWGLYGRQPAVEERFVFRAAGDGDYWFASRTTEAGMPARAGVSFRPELSVVVDTTDPRLDLQAKVDPGGEVTIAWEAFDQHLAPETFKLEYRSGLTAPWRPISTQVANDGVVRTTTRGETSWRPDKADRIVSIRAVVHDKAENDSEMTRRLIIPLTLAARDRSQHTLTASSVPRDPFAHYGLASDAPQEYQTQSDGKDALRERQNDKLQEQHNEYRTPTRSPQTEGVAWPNDNRQDATRQWSNDKTQDATSQWSNDKRQDSTSQWSNDKRQDATSQWSNDKGQDATSQWSNDKTQDATSQWSNDKGQDATSQWSNDESQDSTSQWSNDKRQDATSQWSNDKRQDATSQWSNDKGQDVTSQWSDDYPPSKSRVGPSVARRVPAGRDTSMETTPGESNTDRESSDTKTGGLFGLPQGERPHMTRSKRFNLDYSVDAVGPMGVEKVELWVTRNGGRDWDLWGMDEDRESPFLVSVENQGIYGFRVVIVGRNGLASETPRSGDAADLWVGVDTTKPVADITSAAYGSGAFAGHLDVRWAVSDDHLGAKPITLLISEKRTGPWTPIASGLPNTGQRHWRVDSRVPDRFYLRLEVRDEAGNVTTRELDTPIRSAGLTPKGHVRGIEPFGR